MRKAPGGVPCGPYESDAAGLLTYGWRRWQCRASRRPAPLASVVSQTGKTPPPSGVSTCRRGCIARPSSIGYSWQKRVRCAAGGFGCGGRLALSASTACNSGAMTYSYCSVMLCSSRGSASTLKTWGSRSSARRSGLRDAEPLRQSREEAGGASPRVRSATSNTGKRTSSRWFAFLCPMPNKRPCTTWRA